MEERKPVVGPPGGFWVRAAALILDGAAMAVCLPILGIVTAIVIPLASRSLPKDQASLMAGLIVAVLYLGLPCLYFTLSTAIWGCTLGKLAFNLRVARNDGQPVSFLRAFWRWLCSFLFCLPLGLTGWVAALNDDRRALHDFTSGTKVVLIRPYNQTAMILVLVLLPFGSTFVVGILAAIAIPRFAQMLEKSREGSTKGNMGSLKTAIAIYYGDNNGKWPVNLEKDLVPKYIDKIPAVKVTGAFTRDAESPAGGQVTMAEKGQAPMGSGKGWLYDSSLGNLFVNSTVKDSRGIPYSFYGFE